MTTSTPSPAPAPTTEVKKTWMPTTAGILMIISGTCDFLIGILAVAVAEVIGEMAGMFGLGAFGIPLIIIGVVSILGGVFAIKRKMWWLSLVGAILALMWPSSLLGLLSVIFVALSKKEFK